MFILTTISDLVQILPEELGTPAEQCIETYLNSKYCNKILQSVGLGICVYDILKTFVGLVENGTGIVNVHVDFRLVSFRPFEGEIILGRISSASARGLKIRLDFFDEIHVPPHLMFPNSRFNIEEQTWTWTNNGEEYFYDKLEWVRIRIEAESWADLSPSEPSDRIAETTQERKSPYSLTASMMQSGLGPVEWW